MEKKSPLRPTDIGIVLLSGKRAEKSEELPRMDSPVTIACKSEHVESSVAQSVIDKKANCNKEEPSSTGAFSIKKTSVIKSPERLNYIDFVKGLGIIIIIFGHLFSAMNGGARTADAPDKIFLIIFNYFKLPVFFVVTGWLLSLGRPKNVDSSFCINKAKAIFIPYLLYSVFVISFNYIVIHHNIGAVLANLRQTLLLIGVGALWFMPVYFASYMLFSLSKNNRNAFIAAITFVSIAFLFKIKNVHYILLVKCVIGYMFIYIGYNLRKMNPFLLFAVTAAVVPCTFFNGGIDLNRAILGRSQVFYFLAGSAMSLAAIRLSERFVHKDGIVCFFGRNSLTLMCIHLSFVPLFSKLGRHLSSCGPLGAELIIFAAMLAFLAICCIAVNYAVGLVNGWHASKKN